MIKRWLAVLSLAGCGGGAVGTQFFDTKFGTDGKTLTAFACVNDDAFANAVVAVDGGFVVAGLGCGGWGFAGYTSSGAPDPVFGDGGTTLLFPSAGAFSQVNQLIARPDGRLLARGSLNSKMPIRQLSRAGVVDATFATNVDEAMSSNGGLASAMALQPDGKLLILDRGTLLRVTATGEPDLTFGSLGFTTFSGTTGTYFSKMVLKADGHIVLVSFAFPDEDTEVLQLTASGARDTAFGTNGSMKLVRPANGALTVWSAAAQADGKVILAGTGYEKEGALVEPLVWRVTAAGVLDTTFGTNGRATGGATIGNNRFYAVSLVADGKLLAVGNRETDSLADAWQAERFTSDGKPDTAFADKGTLVFPMTTASISGGAMSVVDTAEGYVLAGRAFRSSGGKTVFGIARVLP